ncbi:MAG: Uma2 family endonuclease, partial [Vulcanimicrobiaceae bacterium]
ALPEWRFSFAPPDASFSSLVPDVGYLARATLDALSPQAAEEPPIAPEIAVEVLSPSDRPIDVCWKTATYLRGGTRLVIVCDPTRRTVTAHDGGSPQVFAESNTFRHPAVPGFELELAALFEGVYRG